MILQCECSAAHLIKNGTLFHTWAANLDGDDQYGCASISLPSITTQNNMALKADTLHLGIYHFQIMI